MAKDKLPTLSDVQLEIVQIVWDRGEVTVTDAWNLLCQRRPVSRNTVVTMMTRLAKKGWLLAPARQHLLLFRRHRARHDAEANPPPSGADGLRWLGRGTCPRALERSQRVPGRSPANQGAARRSAEEQAMIAAITVGIDDWAWPLVGSVLAQVTIIAALALLIGRVLASRDAATRHAVGLVSLGCILLSPLVTALVAYNGWTYWRIPIAGLVTQDAKAVPAAHQPAEPTIVEDSPSKRETMPPTRERPDAQRNPEIAVDAPAARKSASPTVGVTPNATGAMDRISWATVPRIGRNWLACLWALGSGLLLVRLAFGWTQLVRLRRRTRPLEQPIPGPVRESVCRALGIDYLPTIVASANLSQPVAAGLVRPTVILPQNLTHQLDDPQLAAVLVHECAHVIRHDPWVGLMQRLAELLFWPHPLVHWLNRSLSRTREETCDNYVLRRADAADYAHAVGSGPSQLATADGGGRDEIARSSLAVGASRGGPS